MSSIKYIKTSVTISRTVLKEHMLFNEIRIFVKDPFVANINLDLLTKKINKTLPRHLSSGVDIIYVGQFPQLSARNVESAYMDGAIFISNEILNDEVLYNTIIHEIAHGVEKTFGDEVYGDQQIIEEFRNKRLQLRQRLENKELFCDPRLYLHFDYNKIFDDFLYKTVGYDRLAIISHDIFISPYSCTSLREYFASGFEHYFIDQPEYFKKVCPKLFNKIQSLTKI